MDFCLASNSSQLCCVAERPRAARCGATPFSLRLHKEPQRKRVGHQSVPVPSFVHDNCCSGIMARLQRFRARRYRRRVSTASRPDVPKEGKFYLFGRIRVHEKGPSRVRPEAIWPPAIFSDPVTFQPVRRAGGYVTAWGLEPPLDDLDLGDNGFEQRINAKMMLQSAKIIWCSEIGTPTEQFIAML